MRKRGFLVRLGSALILGGAAVLAVYYSDLRQSTSAQRAAREWLGATVAVPPAPLPRRTPPPANPPIRRGDVVGELSIPRLNMSVMIFEGADAGILKIGAGHIPGTALPFGDGNIGIAAHRDTFFRPLRLIHRSDVITL